MPRPTPHWRLRVGGHNSKGLQGIMADTLRHNGLCVLAFFPRSLPLPPASSGSDHGRWVAVATRAREAPDSFTQAVKEAVAAAMCAPSAPPPA